MKSSAKRYAGWPLIIGIVVAVLALTAGPALAALTFSGTSISGDGAVVIESSSTISIGTSTATRVTIGNGSSTVVFPGAAGDQSLTWNAIPTATGMTGLQFGSPEPDLSATDGPANVFSSVYEGDAQQQVNLLEFSSYLGGPELSSYRARGTENAPVDISDGDFLFTHETLGMVGGSWTYEGAENWIHHNDYTLTWFGGDQPYEFGLSAVDSGPTMGFFTLAPGIGEFNNGIPVSEGGSLAQLDLGSAGIGTSAPSTTLQVAAASSTIRIGTASLPGCLEMGNGNGTAGLNYITIVNGVLSATTTKPSACQ